MSIRRTFDVDSRRLDNGYITDASGRLDLILRGLRSCPSCKRIDSRVSASGNGYHVSVSCEGDGSCYVCRMVFDDPYRLELDLLRPVWTREVLWSRKVYRKGGGVLVGEAETWEMIK